MTVQPVMEGDSVAHCFRVTTEHGFFRVTIELDDEIKPRGTVIIYAMRPRSRREAGCDGSGGAAPLLQPGQDHPVSNLAAVSKVDTGSPRSGRGRGRAPQGQCGALSSSAGRGGGSRDARGHPFPKKIRCARVSWLHGAGPDQFAP